MKVASDFEIEHFIKYSKMNGGVLEIFHSKDEVYTVHYADVAFHMTHDALKVVKLRDQNLVIQHKISQ